MRQLACEAIDWRLLCGGVNAHIQIVALEDRQFL
jgi:hypothetical protein